MDNANGAQPIAVVIVDDSPFFRYQLGTRLNQHGWKVVASLASGEDAVRQVPVINPDLVLMDVVMPGMGGHDAVRALRQEWSGPIVMMSAYSAQGIRETWKALDAGANDFIPKPGSEHPIGSMISVVVERFDALRSASANPLSVTAAPDSNVRTHGLRMVVIGASTGGPRALSYLFGVIPKNPSVPILIVQHMPGGFTRSFAERLSSILGSPVIEAPTDGSTVNLSRAPVIVAAGGKHLRVSAHGCWCEDGERRHGVIPSVDVTVLDAASAFGPDLATVILTGMGQDGAEGAHRARLNGGAVVVESRQSALVWGMPGTVATNGDADAIWSLEQIGSWLKKVVSHGRTL